MDDSTKKVQERSDAAQQAKKSLEVRQQQDGNVVEQLKVIITEKETKIKSLELEIRQLRAAAVCRSSMIITNIEMHIHYFWHTINAKDLWMVKITYFRSDRPFKLAACVTKYILIGYAFSCAWGLGHIYVWGGAFSEVLEHGKRALRMGAFRGLCLPHNNTKWWLTNPKSWVPEIRFIYPIWRRKNHWIRWWTYSSKRTGPKMAEISPEKYIPSVVWCAWLVDGLASDRNQQSSAVLWETFIGPCLTCSDLCAMGCLSKNKK